MLDGRYRVTGCIGAGGMGMVYAGEHLGLRRRVAIKVLRQELSHEPRAVERFIREAQAASAIDHENVVKVFDTGRLSDGSAYYVMEFLDGEDLATTLEAAGPLPWSRVRHFALQICAALEAVHRLGIIHRDLKPENCFRVPRGADGDFVKVLDFGISKHTAPEDGPQGLTRTGEVVGTTLYMAPEQARGEPIDHRVDMYAVGVIMFQLLSGHVPFKGMNANQVLAAIITREAPPLLAVAPDANVTDEIVAIVARAMHKDREHRYADAASLAAALRAAPAEVPRPATPLANTMALAETVLSSTPPLRPVEPGATPSVSSQPATAASPAGASSTASAASPVSPPAAAVPGVVTASRRPALLFATAALAVGGLLWWSRMEAQDAPVVSGTTEPPSIPATPPADPLPKTVSEVIPAPEAPLEDTTSGTATTGSDDPPPPSEPTSPNKKKRRPLSIKQKLMQKIEGSCRTKVGQGEEELDVTIADGKITVQHTKSTKHDNALVRCARRALEGWSEAKTMNITEHLTFTRQ